MAERPQLPEGFSWVEPERPQLPEGFSWSDAERPQLPKGFAWADQAPKVAAPREPDPEVYPRATVDSSVTDPFERAAARLRAPYAHPKKEGTVPETAWRLTSQVLQGIKDVPERAVRAAEVYSDPGASPEQKKAAVGEIFGAASLGAPTSVAMGTGKGIARAFMQGHPAAKAEHYLGVQIPTAVEKGGIGAQLLARLPGIGTPLRASAQRAERQLARAGEEAGTIPAGRAVDPEEAGLVLRRGLRDAHGEGRLDMTTGGGAAAAHIINLSNEGAFNTLANLALMPSKEAPNALFAVRGAVPKADWELVQGALVHKLGRKGDVFDLTTFTQSYGKMSEQARNAAFGGSPLKKHLDTLEEVTRKYAGRLEKMSAESMRGVFISPLSLLTTVIGVGAPRLLASHMARPSSVASMASWAKSYDRLLSHPSPGTMAALSLATRNLNNNLETDIDIKDILGKIKESLPEIGARL